MSHYALVDAKGRYIRLANDKVGSLWFSRFSEGLKSRMGYIWKPNKALSTELLLKVIEGIEKRITDESELIEVHPWIVMSAYVIITYVLSLRGSEGGMLDLKGLHDHWTDEKVGYVRIVLYGKLKGEKDYREHYIPCKVESM